MEDPNNPGYDMDGIPLVQGVVGGTAVMTGAGDLGRNGKALAHAVQDAMGQAVLDAMAEGITDPDVIRARMLKARKRVVAAAFNRELEEE